MIFRVLLTVLAFSPTILAQRITIEEAASLALKNNPRLLVDTLNASASEQTTVALRSSFFPNISAGTTAAGALKDSRLAAGALNNPIIFSRFAFGTSVSQLLTDFGRNSDLVESSRLRTRSLRESAQSTRAQILIAVYQAYFTALRERSVLTVFEETIKNRQLMLDQVSALARSNLKSALDVSFAEVNLSESQLALAAARNQYRASLAVLSALLGYPGPRDFELVDVTAPNSAPPPASQIIAEAVTVNPDLAALRLDKEAALRYVSAERKLNYPTVSALASAGFAPAHPEALKNRFGAAGITLNVPVFNGHLFTARRREAEIRAEIVDHRIRDLENRIAQEVTVAALNADTAFQRVELTQRLLQQASLALDLASERYNLGLSSIVELSQAQINKTNAEVAITSAKYDYLTRTAQIDFLLGKLR